MTSKQCSHSNPANFGDLLCGDTGAAQGSYGITTKAFALNLATGFALFTFELTGFFLLKSAGIGRRIYQPKTYLVERRLRVEGVPVNPIKWLRRIFAIKGEELKSKCGLDGYFFVRFIRAMIIIFAPMMAIIVTILLPVNYHGGEGQRVFIIAGQPRNYSVTGLDTLSWQNVAPTQTDRYWAHLFCALLLISWALWRIYKEKIHYISVRQQFLLSPEHRLKASARTVLVTNIPSEYRSDAALKEFFDIFVDDDDQTRLHVWVNRDYTPLKQLVMRRRKLRHALEKAELKLLRLANKQPHKVAEIESGDKATRPISADGPLSRGDTKAAARHAHKDIGDAFYADCREEQPVWGQVMKGAKTNKVTIEEDENGNWHGVGLFQMRKQGQRRKVPKIAWLRFEIARCTVHIEEMMRSIDNQNVFPFQNSAFIQFDRQMSANMACSLVSHHLPGRMTPRYLDVAPHEILWPNMNVTSMARFIRTLCAILCFLIMIVLWGVPASFLAFMSQLESLRNTVTWLRWLKSWPSWIISLIAGPLSAILLALLVQLVVPALCRKLAVLVGAPTRSRREIVTQAFYFTFLFIELVLVTSLSSSIIATLPSIIEDPKTIATTLAKDLPKAANYFFNYLIIQGLGFSGSVLFQYLRVLYITLIWPWFTQTPRQEAWLQTTIPHQMWGNVYPLMTNFAVIGLIYSIIAPLMLVFITCAFSILWFAYRHNYYYVQRVKVDTHGMLFCQALSQLFTGIYVLEVALIGLFFLVRNTDNDATCVAQAVIMIVALALTAAYHYILEEYLRPLYTLLPVSLEDSAASAERQRFSYEQPGTEGGNDTSARVSVEVSKAISDNPDQLDPNQVDGSVLSSARQSKEYAGSARMANAADTSANAIRTLQRMRKRVVTRLERNETHASIDSEVARRMELADQLGSAIAEYPDELTDLSLQERKAELKVAYEDPVTREPAPIIWIPQDERGISEEMIKSTGKYGRFLQYSNSGAYLTKKGKCEIVRPAPDVRPDWLLDWVL